MTKELSYRVLGDLPLCLEFHLDKSSSRSWIYKKLSNFCLCTNDSGQVIILPSSLQVIVYTYIY